MNHGNRGIGPGGNRRSSFAIRPIQEYKITHKSLQEIGLSLFRDNPIREETMSTYTKALDDGLYKPQNLYVVYDRIAEESGNIFGAINDGVALRNFNNLLSKTPPAQQPEYRLYCVGTYNNRTMELKIIYPVEEVFSSEEK